MKKAVSIVLTLLLMLQVLPLGIFTFTASAATEGYYTYTVSGGKATITDVDTSISGYIVIPSILGGYPVTSIGDRSFDSCRHIDTITLPEGVTSIGYKAFDRCSARSINIPSSVIAISDGAFNKCEKLAFFHVSDDNAYYCTIDGVLFSKNKSTLVAYPAGKKDGSYTLISSYSIPDGVTRIRSEAFYGCSHLTSITIPHGVTSIGDLAFYNCGFTSIAIPSSVTSIGDYAFDQCHKLASIQVAADNASYCDVDGVLFSKNKSTLVLYPSEKKMSLMSYRIV